jgi:hypothetical protein
MYVFNTKVRRSVYLFQLHKEVLNFVITFFYNIYYVCVYIQNKMLLELYNIYDTVVNQ